MKKKKGFVCKETVFAQSIGIKDILCIDRENSDEFEGFEGKKFRKK
jgi:hypothetical protein